MTPEQFLQWSPLFLAIPAALWAVVQTVQARSAHRKWDQWNQMAATYDSGSRLHRFATAKRDQQVLRLAVGNELRVWRVLVALWLFAFGGWAALWFFLFQRMGVDWIAWVAAGGAYIVWLWYIWWSSRTRKRVAERLDLVAGFSLLGDRKHIKDQDTREAQLAIEIIDAFAPPGPSVDGPTTSLSPARPRRVSSGTPASARPRSRRTSRTSDRS